MRITKQVRKDVATYYTMRDELRVQLRVVTERGGVRAVVRPSSGDGDVMSIAFLVLMEAAKSAQDDLKAIMEKVKGINSQKKKLRELLDEQHSGSMDLEATFELMALAMESHLDRLKCKSDEMSEMGEMESLRLQMAMDRLSKMMSTLSNLLKKASDTASSVVQNLK